MSDIGQQGNIKGKKPKIKFCHECGKKLFGNAHVELGSLDDCYKRTFHISCATELLKTPNSGWIKLID